MTTKERGDYFTIFMPYTNKTAKGTAVKTKMILQLVNSNPIKAINI